MALTTNEADKYEVLNKIGHGSFGIIHRVRRKTDSKILCRKEIEYVRMSQKEREQLHAEFSILSSLRHPNIVAYYHREHLKPKQELHLYMEYCGGGDLGKYIKGLRAKNQLADEAYVWSVVSQLVTALYRCHHGEDPPEVGDNVMAPPKNKPTSLQSKSKIVILHRDLKPENVFLGEDEQVKLGDFGLSKLIQSNDFASTYVGTPYYMSPEICAAERYGPHSDIWSLGCIIYELCKQKPPFDAQTHYHLVQKIKLGRVEPLPPQYSPELQNLIKSCLNVNPDRRPDTWALIQMPVIRLMRKEREVVELGKELKTQQMQCKQMKAEAEALLANMERDQHARDEKARLEIEAQLRREWELKARLEIDRQVAIERQKLIDQYEPEVARGVAEGLEKAQAIAMRPSGTSSPTEAPKVECGPAQTREEVPKESTASRVSSAHTIASVATEASDISTFSMDGPPLGSSQSSVDSVSLHNNNLAVPMKKARTPFSRARTQIDSPADIQMASPSPMSIASLSLSPRRTAALTQGVSGNLFNVANAQQQANTKTSHRGRWQPQGLSPMNSDDEDEPPSDEDDGVPELPSPTRMPRAVPDPFKMRPGMKRQKTAPINRMVAQQQPTLFSGPGLQPPSPTRVRRPLGKAITAIGSGGGEDMLKAVHARNMRNDNALEGRTLVELNQGKAPERAMEKMALEPPARWDPEETPDMPSPFIRRGRGILPVR